MNRSLATSTALILSGALGVLAPSHANILPGMTAPDFTKTELDASPPAARSLSDYAGKVVVLFLFGYNCPVCIGDCPGFEQDVWQYYQSAHPGEVQVLGADVWNGTVQGVRDFRDQTGASFPLLLQGAAPAGGDLSALYGPWDNYIVINKQGIVRYHAANSYPHGNRYHLNELRATVDSLVGSTVEVPPPSTGSAIRLSAGPNPFRGATAIQLAIPGATADARIEVLDVQGRRVTTLHAGPLAAGASRFAWDGRDARGSQPAPGLYLVRASVGEQTFHQRLVRLP